MTRIIGRTREQDPLRTAHATRRVARPGYSNVTRERRSPSETRAMDQKGSRRKAAIRPTRAMWVAVALTVVALAPGASARTTLASAGGLLVYSSGTFSTSSDEPPQFDIFVSAPDGTGRSQRTSMAEYEQSPAWSPDGTRIVFSHGADDCTPPPGGTICGGNNLYVMNADGSNVTLLTTDDQYNDNATQPHTR